MMIERVDPEDTKENDDPSKVSLIVENATFRVKKEFLMGVSCYFEAMFSCDMRESREGVATINETKADIFEKIVKFYEGHSLKLTEENAFHFLTTAAMFQFKKAVEQVVTFLCHILSPKNCLKILNVSYAHNIKELINSSLNFALWEFDAVSVEEEFFSLPVVDLCQLLDNVLLNTASETNVLKAVMRWMERHAEVDPKEVEKILQNVRFQLIPKKELEAVLENPLWENKGCTHVIRSYYSPGWQALHPVKTERRIPWVVCASGGYHAFRDPEEGETFIKNPHAPNSQVSAVDLSSLRQKSDATVEPFQVSGLPMIDPEDKISYLWGAKSISIGGYLYLFGGEIKTQTQQKWNLDVWRYCIFDQKWSEVGTMPCPRRHHAAVEFGGKIYLIGGFGRHRIIQASVDCFDTKLHGWSKVPSMKKSKHNPAACFHKDRLYAISTSVESWAPGEATWSPVDICLPFHYGVLALVSFKQRLFLFTRHFAGVFELFLDKEPLSHVQLANLIDCPLSACVHQGEVVVYGGKKTNHVCKVRFLGNTVEEEIVGRVSRVYMEHSICMLPLYPCE